MKPPPLLIAAVLLFWGWQGDQLLLSVIIAVFLEVFHLVKPRYSFSPSDFNRISDLCVVIALGTAVYFFLTNKPVTALFLTIQWLPLSFVPLIFSQVFSTTARINISGFFLIIRKRYPEGRPAGPFINLSYPYLALCLLSAGVANSSNHSFYFGFVFLSAWALWTTRTLKFSFATWVILLLFATTAGYIGHVGLHNLHLLIERKVEKWFAGWSPGYRDPFRNTTAIGDIGPLKQSDRILFRVKLKPVERLPILLREASYNIYRNSVWFVKHARFKPVKPTRDENTWILGPQTGPYNMITVITYLKDGRGLLKLPLGTVKISQLPVASVQVNQMGAVKVEGGPGFIAYTSEYQLDNAGDGPPNKDDLFVPEKEKDAIRQIIKTSDLLEKPSLEVIQEIKALFQKEFKYSLLLHRGPSDLTPISNFLLHTRSGHCEYFTTATVLLLRELGLPARYVSGYSVQEFDPLEKGFVVRARHAHAWALAYVGGGWQNVDTTPPSWFDLETEKAALWEPLMDLWFLGKIKFSEWRSRSRNNGAYWKYTVWFFVPVIAFLIMLFLTRRKNGQKKEKEDIGQGKISASKGLDSPFFKVEKKINQNGFFRNHSETFIDFIKRIEDDHSLPKAFTAPLLPLLKLHYRIRFDPRGLNAHEKLEFAESVQRWMEQQVGPLPKKNNGLKRCLTTR